MLINDSDSCPCDSGKVFSECHKGAIATLKSKRFVISVKEDDQLYKIFSIRFFENKKKDITGLQIDFPYTLKHKGLLTLTTLPKNKITVGKLNLRIGGKVTSHNVKYSHWSDGRVHFSGDGKIYKTHDKISFPLLSHQGHLFTLQAKGFKGFQQKKDSKVANSNQVDLDVDIESGKSTSVKVTGWWHDCQDLRVTGNEIVSKYNFTSARGDRYLCFALEAPQGYKLSGKVLLLCFRKEPFMTKEKGSHIVFMAGFDQKGIWNDLNQEAQFLTLLYPVRAYEKTLNEIGSADYIKDEPKT